MNGIFAIAVKQSAFSTINELNMDTFGKKLRECREAKKISQSELARLLNTNHSIIGKYERDEVKPTIDVIKRLAENLTTTAGFLLGETMDSNLFKDPVMMKRFNEVNELPEEDKHCVFSMMDAYLAKHKMQAYLK
jgi:transcriptional regulator with XRE-family HTH domain